MSSVGCSWLSAATIRSTGRLTGITCSGVCDVENVRRKAAETCVGLDAATTAATRPKPASAGSEAQSRCGNRIIDAQQIAHASQP
jgi:hypothetical protein